MIRYQGTGVVILRYILRVAKAVIRDARGWSRLQVVHGAQ